MTLVFVGYFTGLRGCSINYISKTLALFGSYLWLSCLDSLLDSIVLSLCIIFFYCQVQNIGSSMPIAVAITLWISAILTIFINFLKFWLIILFSCQRGLQSIFVNHFHSNLTFWIVKGLNLISRKSFSFNIWLWICSINFLWKSFDCIAVEFRSYHMLRIALNVQMRHCIHIKILLNL